MDTRNNTKTIEAVEEETATQVVTTPVVVSASSVEDEGDFNQPLVSTPRSKGVAFSDIDTGTVEEEEGDGNSESSDPESPVKSEDDLDDDEDSTELLVTPKVLDQVLQSEEEPVSDPNPTVPENNDGSEEESLSRCTHNVQHTDAASVASSNAKESDNIFGFNVGGLEALAAAAATVAVLVGGILLKKRLG